MIVLLTLCSLLMAIPVVCAAARPPKRKYHGREPRRPWVYLTYKRSWGYFHLGIGERTFYKVKLWSGDQEWAYGSPLLGITSRGISVGWLGWKDDLGRVFQEHEW